MLVPLSFDSLDMQLRTSREQELLAMNEELRGHNLALTRQDASDLLASRGRALKNQGRVELGAGVMQALLRRLAESAYITQENFVTMACELYEVFHFVKNETSDRVGDEELLDAVMLYFEKVCGGSAELLMGKGAERIVENFRQRRELADTQRTEEEEDWTPEE